ncbi:hypothetical protein CAP39_07420 [Sphingomonas sp. IBVSS1]|nr:hypothetical protein CAP39_07420 [Sphingomonas sp. IBVSS1]
MRGALRLLPCSRRNRNNARATLARIDAGEGTMPGEVSGAILDEDLHPIAAWRHYRGLSQAGLARRAGSARCG